MLNQMIESKKYRRLSIAIQPVRMRVAHDRLGIFQLKYAGGIQRRKAMPEKTVKGISGMAFKKRVSAVLYTVFRRGLFLARWQMEVISGQNVWVLRH